MNSQELYLDIKENSSKKAFPHFKKLFLPYIQNKYTNNCKSTAEDYFANAFMKLLEKIQDNKLANYSNITGYFIMICKNDFVSQYKRNKVKYTPNYILEVENKLVDVVSYSQPELKKITLELLEKLPNQLKNISYKLFVEGKNHKEVAEELNIKYDHVRKYQHKALLFLREKIPANYQEYLFAA